jgi:hypothetical protein
VAAGALLLLGKTEVENLHSPVGEQEDVLGLQVAVDDAALVRRGEPGGDLRRDLHGLARRRRSAVQALAQRLAEEELHDRERLVALPADVVDGEDVGMREGGDRLRLALEAGERVGARREMRRQHLERHVALEPRVARPIDLPHPSSPELAQDLVRPEPISDRERHAPSSID